ncbi:POU domain, class 6, transcription factor 1 isoform X3 [Lepus europaeus]|uniref:POU domain, class 6, transcription factor 1 isoform X3 n=1 Tax=Lepus europaeus TaxID=9983 RepID=UPI002B49E92F|nr:POU domain, class 6, transcription factor 1 isoform X3 [Lepus europaeus]
MGWELYHRVTSAFAFPIPSYPGCARCGLAPTPPQQATMDPGAGSESSLTVNEQVIVMSGHETIRVLEVGVDAQLPAEEEGKGLEAGTAEGSHCGDPAEASEPAGEAGPDKPEAPAEATAKSLPGIPPSPAPAIATFSQAPSQPQAASQTLTPLAVQAAPQVLTQENLATVLTGVMVPAGAVTQPLLIPISIAGQVAGQQGLAVWTIPTATVATLPGLAAASPTGAVFKPPLAGLQAAAVLTNTALPAPVQAAPPVQTSSLAQPRPPAQPQTLFQTQPLLQTAPAILPQPTAAATTAAPTPKPVDTPPQITVQPAGFAFSPGIVIGTLPWVVNSASVAAPAPAQSLQVQAVTPQLLLNAQGQVIATLASSPLPPPVAVRKPSTPESPAKSEVQPIQPTPAAPPPAVVIASPAPAVKPSASAPIPITCSETPTVSQLVSKPHTPSLDEDGINLEEIREFAKNFKIRRLSLGLTQTQVGQALTATEGPAYSQSAICRFEKLDITPKSAQKLKPVLERWLNEAELRNQEGQQNLMEFVGGEPSKKRKRRTSFTPQAIEALNAYFEKNPLPTGQEITEIAKELNYDREVVRVWFCNRRQTLKNTSKLNVFQIP